VNNIRFPLLYLPLSLSFLFATLLYNSSLPFGRERKKEARDLAPQVEGDAATA